MKKCHSNINQMLFFGVFIILFANKSWGQEPSTVIKKSSVLWEKVQFGGNIGLNISSGLTNILVAPSGLYNYNKFVSYGVGVNFNYTSSTNNFSSIVYGINTIVLFNPLPQIQVSINLGQSRVYYKQEGLSKYNQNYWDTSLKPGLGYRTGNVTFGFEYNLLRNRLLDSDPVVPFVRAYF